MPWLINASQLEKFRKNQKNVIILDASWHLSMGAEQRDAKQEFLNEHLIGARFLDLNEFADPHGDLANMLIRDEKLISEKMGALGITNDHKIIFYDSSSHHSSCRALWMFKVFGHNPNQLYILDGGFEAWKNFGGKLEAGESRNIMPRPYTVTFESHYIRTLVQMKTNLHHPQEQVIDVRHPVRYAGGHEPRLGLRVGHMPGSVSFPYMTMFEKDGLWKPLDKIRRQLIGVGIDLNVSIITTCGSGMTAAILNFTLDLLNHSNHALYDGSWAEWGAQKLYAGESGLEERPVVTSLDT